jgi:penicillin V acylase-like amidase (Ntn superfamily)
VKVLTNSTYESSIAHYNAGHFPPRTDYSSLARFYRVADLIAKYNSSVSGPALEYAWSILGSVNRGDRTKWSLLFDVADLRIYFKTNTNHSMRTIDFSECDFSCSTPVKIFDINAPLTGNVLPHCIDYNYDTNRAIISAVAKKLGPQFPETPEWIIDRVAQYPDHKICGSNERKP